MTKKKPAPPAAPGPVKFKLAEIVPPPEQTSGEYEGVPDEFLSPNAESATRELTPTVNFENAGDAVWGVYVGQRELAIQGRKTRLYTVKLDPKVGGAFASQEVSAWGSTILDQRLTELAPVTGDRVFIGYVGDVSTSRGLNPAKQFEVIVTRRRK